MTSDDIKKDRSRLIGELFQWQAAGVGEKGYNHFLMFPVDFVSVKRQGTLSIFGTGDETEINLNEMIPNPFVAFSVGIAEYYERDGVATISGEKRSAAVAFKTHSDRDLLVKKISADPFIKSLLDDGTAVMITGEWKNGELDIPIENNIVPLKRKDPSGDPAP